MLEVRREYGEPFSDVVKGFAEMGYSQRLTAEVLGFNLSYFRQLLKRFGLLAAFNRPQRDLVKDCRPGGKGRARGVRSPRSPRYSDRDLLQEVRRYHDIALFDTMSDVALCTVQRRFGTFSAAVEAARSGP
jgi:hypothetical protein